jgi:hypothetical protein
VAVEDRAFGEDEGPLGGEAWVGIESDTDVAGGARHSRDGYDVRRDECEKVLW